MMNGSFSATLSGFVDRLGHELFDFDRSESLGERIHFRVVEALLAVATVSLCWNWGWYIQKNINESLLELGLAQYLDVSFMFDHYIAVGNAIFIAVLVVLGFARMWRPAYALALFLFHLQYVSRYILGEISHGSNLVGMGILGLGLAHFYFSDEQRRRRFVFGFLYFFIGLGYTSSAFCKLIGTGVHWADGHHLWMWIAERKVDVLGKFGTFEPNMLQELILSDAAWGTLVLAFGHLAELSAILMWWRRFRRPILFLVLSMHIGIAFTMNIVFWWTTMLLALLAFPWDALFDWVYAAQRSPTVRARGAE